ncbi:MAG TPA: hypothetical protein ACFYEK_10935 [Candidatus Wunengus sp. YC60]|uniref:hypothetical protein n=1 Tax=Candidatus Wunengus sp. YC60 TaxID=3367697 RepID=UPI004024C838
MTDLSWLKVHHRDKKGNLIKTTPRRMIQRKGYPDLFIKIDTDDNKFTYLDNTPYKDVIPSDVKKEFAYLFENLDNDTSVNKEV